VNGDNKFPDVIEVDKEKSGEGAIENIQLKYGSQFKYIGSRIDL